ncbi:MAG: hypothetical protein JO065_19720 [Acidobacteria bacterium]|nr:hypothetical protein [Acidobacteriota bacterium]
MPCDYRIDSSRRLVITTASGAVSFEEIVAHQKRLQGDPEFVPEFDQLLDCRSATNLNVSSEQARLVAQRKLFSRTSKRALVAGNPVVFGIGRMLQAYNELAPHGSVPRVFYDMKIALEWLHRTELLPVLVA